MNASSLNDQASDAEFTRQVKARLDAERVSPAVATRLARARHEAVQYAMPSPGMWLREWAPAAGVAMAAAVAVLMWPAGDHAPGTPQRAPHTTIEAELDDLDIILAGESLELYEDLEFFQWLATQDLG